VFWYALSEVVRTLFDILRHIKRSENYNNQAKDLMFWLFRFGNALFRIPGCRGDSHMTVDHKQTLEDFHVTGTGKTPEHTGEPNKKRHTIYFKKKTISWDRDRI
jgi:hypothetical protein